MSNEPKELKPKLRFPEFENAAGWAAKPLGSLARRVAQRNSELEETHVLSNSAERGIVDQRDYFDKDIANRENLGGYLIVEHGDYVYNPRISNFAPVGPISKNRADRGVMSPLYTVFRFADHQNEFFAQYFKSHHWHHYLRQASNSGARHDRMSVSSHDFFMMPIPVPDADERQKIADCLGSMDDVIEAEGRKLKGLQKHRQGLLQALFPPPGQTRPCLRFRKFDSAGDWEEEKLDEHLAMRGTGHTPNKAKAEFYNGGVGWVSLADSKRLDQGLISETAIEISEEGINNSSAVLHPTGSVILSRDAGVGKSAILSRPMAVSQHFIAWICDPTKLSNWFLYYQLQFLKPLFEQIAAGNTIKTIGLPFFKAMKIVVPRLAEQEAIAGCLSTLDKQIAAQAQKVVALEAHKRGLLQQLFPSAEASRS